ncbi:MAG: diaminopimelate epimerase, partial [Candidatus Dormibacteraeota bacterium]|nr:diaminopimelate epimerase [Candidatus Dormibacteraeota bacterium]
MATYELTKYQALGNDYLVLDLPADLDSLRAFLPVLCDRRRGLGSDGLLAFDRERMSVRILNPDGSEAEKSGNGLRIVACHAILEHEAPERFVLHTQDHANGVRVLSVGGPEVWSAIEIGKPRFEPDDWVELETEAATVRARLVDVGNPHCVVFGEPVTEARALQLGPLLERHPRFPNRTNVQLAEVRDPAHVSAVIWERGAGYTPASGTSASAVAAAAMRIGLAGDEVAVAM